MANNYRNRLVGSAVLAVTFFLFIAPAASAEQPLGQRAEHRLREVYNALTEYIELTGTLPDSLRQLATLGLVSESALVDPRVTHCDAIPAGLRGGWVISKKGNNVAVLAGDMVGEKQLILGRSGNVIDLRTSATLVYGHAANATPVRDVTARHARQPGAIFGVVIDPADNGGPNGKAPVVTGIIPGFTRSLGGQAFPADLQVGDVILNLGGAQVRTFEAFEKVIQQTDWSQVDLKKDLELRVLRGEKVVRVRPLQPVDDIGADIEPDPLAVYERAMVWLHPAGPGRLPVTLGDKATGSTTIMRIFSDAGDLRIGDVVTMVEATPVRSGPHMGHLISKFHAGTRLRVGVQRGAQRFVTTVRLSPIPRNMISDGRLAIFVGQLDVPRGMMLARPFHVTSIILLLEQGVSPAAAMKWIDTVLADKGELVALIHQTAQRHRERLQKNYSAAALRYDNSTPIYWKNGRGATAAADPAPPRERHKHRAAPPLPPASDPPAKTNKMLRFVNRAAGVSLIASDAFKTQKNFDDDVILHIADLHPTDELQHRVFFIRRVDPAARLLISHRDARANAWKKYLKNFRVIDAATIRVGAATVPWFIYQYEHKANPVRVLAYFYRGADGKIYEVSAVESAKGFAEHLLQYRKVLATFKRIKGTIKGSGKEKGQKNPEASAKKNKPKQGFKVVEPAALINAKVPLNWQKRSYKDHHYTAHLPPAWEVKHKSASMGEIIRIQPKDQKTYGKDTGIEVHVVSARNMKYKNRTLDFLPPADWYQLVFKPKEIEEYNIKQITAPFRLKIWGRLANAVRVEMNSPDTGKKINMTLLETIHSGRLVQIGLTLPSEKDKQFQFQLLKIAYLIEFE